MSNVKSEEPRKTTISVLLRKFLLHSPRIIGKKTCNRLQNFVNLHCKKTAEYAGRPTQENFSVHGKILHSAAVTELTERKLPQGLHTPHRIKENCTKGIRHFEYIIEYIIKEKPQRIEYIKGEAAKRGEPLFPRIHTRILPSATNCA